MLCKRESLRENFPLVSISLGNLKERRLVAYEILGSLRENGRLLGWMNSKARAIRARMTRTIQSKVYERTTLRGNRRFCERMKLVDLSISAAVVTMDRNHVGGKTQWNERRRRQGI
jgi:hypothetical protein